MSEAPKLSDYLTTAKKSMGTSWATLNDADTMEQTILLWQRDIVAYLRGMIDEWEGVDPDDRTLYTLGLRRAIDVVNGTYVHPRDVTTKTETDDDDVADYDRRSVLPPG
jgi:hypothetical protein